MDIKNYYKVYDNNKRFIRRINQKDELQENNFLYNIGGSFYGNIGDACLAIYKNSEAGTKEREV